MVLMNLVENVLVDTMGKGEGGMNWESSIEKYTISCVKQIVESYYRTQGVWPAVLCWPRGVGLEKARAPHSSTLAWKIPWMEEPGRLWSMGSLRVRHNWATSLSLLTFMHWRRKWQPTPVFLPGESQGRGSLVGWHLWGRTESDTTELT